MRKQHDQFFKTLAEADPRGLLDILGILPLDRVADVSPLDRELIREPVLIDQGFVVHEPSADWIAHIEAFSNIGTDDWERVVWYAAELTVRTNLPVRSTVLLMLEQYAPRVVPQRVEVRRGSFVASLEIETVRIWEVPAERLLRTGRPRLLTWVPITRSIETDWLDAAQRISEVGDGMMNETFQVLGELRYGKEVWENFLERRGLKMITSEFLYEHSPTLRGWFEKGRVEGRKEGWQEALGGMLRMSVASRFPDLTTMIPTDEQFISEELLQKAIEGVILSRNESEARQWIESVIPTSLL